MCTCLAVEVPYLPGLVSIASKFDVCVTQFLAVDKAQYQMLLYKAQGTECMSTDHCVIGAGLYPAVKTGMLLVVWPNCCVFPRD